MSEQDWTFTGSIKKFGSTRAKKGGHPASWGSLWLLLTLDPITSKVDGEQYIVQENKLFVSIDLDYTEDSKKGKRCKLLLASLAEGKQVIINSAKITMMKRSKKNEKGEWEPYEQRGIKCSAFSVTVCTEQQTSMNMGKVSGKVVKQFGNKLLIQDVYTIPGKGKTERKTRDVPLLIPDHLNKPLSGKYILCMASLSGKNNEGIDTVFGIVNRLYEI